MQRVLRVYGIAISLMCVIVLCGCQPRPKGPVIISKNDGSFEDRIRETSLGQPNSCELNRKGTFASTDGSVVFTWMLEQPVEQSAMPVVEVVPHYLTGENVRNVMEVLFKNAQFYEKEQEQDHPYSQKQLQDLIRFWTEVATPDALKTICGTTDPDDLKYVKELIKYYTEKMENAPTEDNQIPFDWKFRDEGYYMPFSSGNDIMFATTRTDKAEYLMNAVTRNELDYKLNGITVRLGSGRSLGDLERQIYKYKLCCTEKPSEEQLKIVSEKAENLLNQMQLGEWAIVETRIETEDVDDVPLYIIRVQASPVFNGVVALNDQGICDLTADDAVSSNYYMTQAFFEFSANGELVFFGMDSPIDVKGTVNDKVRVLSIDELLERAEDHLSLSDSKAGYGIPAFAVAACEENVKEKLISKVEISELEYRLGRIKVRDAEDSYYYVPVMCLKGSTECYGMESGKQYIKSGDFGDSIQNLLWINAVDGSIIR